MNILPKHIYLIFISLVLFTETVSAYSEAHFKKIRKEFTLFPNQTLQVDYYKELEINSLMALNRLYGETFIIYNPDFQKLKINYSYTCLPNGDTLNTPANAFNEVLPEFAANAPAFNHLKEMVITHTGLEPQARIHLNYTLISSCINNLDIDEILQEESPVKEYQIVINIPENQPLNYQLFNLSGKPKITQTIHGKQYSWTFKNLPPALHEPFQTKDQSHLPHFIANSYNSTQSSLEILSNKFHIANSEEINLFTKQLTQNCQNDLDKVFTVKDFITNRISTINLPPEYLNWEIRRPEKVFQKAYGTPAEKINLFISMLQSVGIKASIAVIYPGSYKNTIQGQKPVRQLLVYTLSNGFPLFLSVDGSEIISPELRGERDHIFLLDPNEIRPLTVLPSVGNISCQTNIKLTPGQATIKGNISLNGGLIQTEKNTLYQEKIKKVLALPGDSLKIQYNNLTSFQNNLNFESKSYIDSSQAYISYSLPEPGIGVHSWKMLPLNSKRAQKLEIPYAIKESHDYIIQLDPRLKLMNIEEEIQEKQTCGNVYIKISQRADKIHIHREINLSAALISPKAYSGFRKILNIWANKKYKTLIFNNIQ